MRYQSLMNSPKCDHVFHRVWEDLHIIPINYKFGVEVLKKYGNLTDIDYLVQDTESKEDDEEKDLDE